MQYFLNHALESCKAWNCHVQTLTSRQRNRHGMFPARGGSNRPEFAGRCTRHLRTPSVSAAPEAAPKPKAIQHFLLIDGAEYIKP